MSNTELKDIGLVLKIFRKRARLTQQQLARRMNVSHHTISGWERGDHAITLHKFLAFCAATETDVIEAVIWVLKRQDKRRTQAADSP